MSDSIEFNELVDGAMVKIGNPTMRPVVEKELFHYEIFSALKHHNLLDNLTFQGGTSLRLCRGSNRFSEDIDFAGGKEFKVSDYETMASVIQTHIGDRFNLNVFVKPPKNIGMNINIEDIIVNKWQVSIVTNPNRKDIPRQRIKLEIANVPSHDPELVLLRNNYNYIQDREPLIIQAETLNEVLADKLLAFPICSKVIRYRDVWDIAWILQQPNTSLNMDLLKLKINDYHVPLDAYLKEVREKINTLDDIVRSPDFKNQMSRFIEKKVIDSTLNKEGFNDYLINTVANILLDVENDYQEQPTFKL